MKSPLFYLSILFLMVALSCAPSPGPESVEAGAFNEPAKKTSTNEPISPEVTSSLDVKKDRGIKMDDTKLIRLIDYVKYSKLVSNHAMILHALLTLFNHNYDWKTSEESQKPYLKGGKENPLGKLLMIIPGKHYSNETYLGLIEILENKKLLQELIDFFTSKPFMAPQNRKDLIDAIQNNDQEKIEEILDKTYIAIFKEFSRNYALSSTWEKGKDGSYTFKEGGFEGDQEGIYEGFVGYSDENVSFIRKSIVKLFMLLVENYFDLKSPGAVEASLEQPEKKASGE